MGFSIPANAMTIGFQLLGAITNLMQNANEAFSGQPGSGAKKKEWAMAAAAEAMKTENLIAVDLTTPEQEAAVLETFDKGIEFIFSATATAKLFQTPAA